MSTDAIDTAWLDALREACAASSQADVARRLSVAGDGKYPSAVLLSRVLTGAYEHDIGRLQALVEGVLMGGTVDCPVLGDLPRQRCLEHQSRRGSFSATNPSRVLLYRECPSCPNNLERKP